jgi:hypothetical protein
VVPALGLKFLVDGAHPSENLVVMRMLDSQQSRLPLSPGQHSVFQNPFTNILPGPSLPNVVMQVVKERFETVVEKGTGLHQPVNNLAMVRGNGERIQNPAAPYRIIFSPSEKARAASDPELDFREDLAQNIPEGTMIYQVFALEKEQEDELNGIGAKSVEDLLAHAKKIGALTTESEFIASGYGDFRLFFKHNTTFMRNDLRAVAGSAGS